jgi:hypothetical protein
MLMYEVIIIDKSEPLIVVQTDHNKKTAQLRRELSPKDIISYEWGEE